MTVQPIGWRVASIPAAPPITYYANHIGSVQEAMQQAYDTGQYTLRQIADYFGVHHSTVSRAVGRRKIR